MTKSFSKTWRLIRNYFDVFIGTLIKNKRQKRYIISIAILALIGLAIIAYFCLFGFTITKVFVDKGFPQLALYVDSVFIIMGLLMIVLMRSITPSKANDDNFLLSLPVSKSSVIIAKAAFSYLLDAAIMLLVIIPLFTIYVIVAKASIAIIFHGFLLALILPLFGNAISSIISIFFYRLVRRFRYFNLIQTFLLAIITLAFMFVMYYFQYAMLADNTTINMDLLPVKLIMSFSNDGNIVSFLIILAFSMIPFALSVFIRSLYIGKETKSYMAKSQDLDFPFQSPKVSLLKKEISYYFSIPLYVMNTGIGFIMLIVASIALFFLDINQINTILESLLGSSTNATIMVLIVVGFIMSMSSTTSPSISLEGKTLWIIKSNPVKFGDLAFAKVMTNMVVGILPIILATVAMTIRIDYHYWWAYFLMPTTCLLCMALSGLAINLLFPKLTWKNEVEPIKQGISVLLTMLVGMVISIIPLIVYLMELTTFISLDLFLIIMIGCYLVISIIVYLLLKYKGEKWFYKLC